MHSALFWQLHENTNHKCNKLALAIICIAISLLSCQLCVDFHKQQLNFEKKNGKTELKGHDQWARTSFMLEIVVQILFFSLYLKAIMIHYLRIYILLFIQVRKF